MAFGTEGIKRMEKIWLKSYPPGVPHDVKPEQYRSVAQLL